MGFLFLRGSISKFYEGPGVSCVFCIQFLKFLNILNFLIAVLFIVLFVVLFIPVPAAPPFLRAEARSNRTTRKNRSYYPSKA